jgi:hypothetical protein
MNKTTKSETVWALKKGNRLYVYLNEKKAVTVATKDVESIGDFYTFCEKQRAVWHQQEYGWGDSVRLKGFKPVEIKVTVTHEFEVLR